MPDLTNPPTCDGWRGSVRLPHADASEAEVAVSGSSGPDGITSVLRAVALRKAPCQTAAAYPIPSRLAGLDS
jgi:hypothetical protein